MKYSVIIPVYNGQNTVSRTLDSLSVQKLKNEFEIIIINDCCTDDSMKIVESYKDKLNIKIYKIEKNSFHCPGNSRQLGIEKATGDWITFIDQDDQYYEDAFDIVNENLDNEYLVCFKLVKVDEDGNKELVDTKAQLNSWLHGKFYNRKNLIEKYNIRFKKDLLYAEDIFFNKIVNRTCYEIGICSPFDFDYKDIYICEWLYNETSITNTKNRVDGKFYHNEFTAAVALPEILINYMCDIRNILKEDDIKEYNIYAVKVFSQIYTTYLMFRNDKKELAEINLNALINNKENIKEAMCNVIDKSFYKFSWNFIETFLKEVDLPVINYPSYNDFVKQLTT